MALHFIKAVAEFDSCDWIPPSTIGRLAECLQLLIVREQDNADILTDSQMVLERIKLQQIATKITRLG